MVLTFLDLVKQGSSVAFSSFRPIYYLGCKNEFTSAIKAAVDEVDPSGGRLGDLFAGTGAVAAALSPYREVLTSDIQEYSRVLCSAVLNPSKLPCSDVSILLRHVASRADLHLTEWCFQPLIAYEQKCLEEAEKGSPNSLVELLEAEPIAAWELSVRDMDSAFSIASGEVVSRLKHSNLWSSPNTTVSRLFGGVYFSYRQAVELDLLLAQASDSRSDRDTLVAAALSTASVLVNTVGKQFAQPIRPRNKFGSIKSGLVEVVRRDRSMNTFDTYEIWLNKYIRLHSSPNEALCFRQDYLSAIKHHASGLSVLYADPPYTRDHYSRFYHVLETMCLRDNPDFSKVTKNGKIGISRGLYRDDRHQSDFCIRSLAPNAFNALFLQAHESGLPLVVSYSPHEAGDGTHPRVVSMEQIIHMANQHYKRVEIVTITGSTHNNLNRTGLKLKEREHAEILLKCYR